jgi:hypothetical protein
MGHRVQYYTKKDNPRKLTQYTVNTKNPNYALSKATLSSKGSDKGLPSIHINFIIIQRVPKIINQKLLPCLKRFPMVVVHQTYFHQNEPTS